MIEEKLRLTEDEFKNIFSKKFLIENKLNSLLKKYELFELIDLIYPNKYKPWEFNIVKNAYYKENVEVIIKWLIKDKLKIKEDKPSKKSLIKIYNDPLFNKLLSVNNKTPLELIQFVYPHEVTAKDLKNIL